MPSVVDYTDTKRAVDVDLLIEERGDLDFPITLQNKDGSTRLVTDWDAIMQIREYRDSEVVLLELSTDNSKIVTSDGKITLRFVKEDFTEITWRTGVYDLKIISPTGKEEWIMEGEFKVSAMVTR